MARHASLEPTLIPGAGHKASSAAHVLKANRETPPHFMIHAVGVELTEPAVKDLGALRGSVRLRKTLQGSAGLRVLGSAGLRETL